MMPSTTDSCRASGNRGVKEMKDSAKYVKIVEWSEEDHCYVGSAPGLLRGGCHGADEKQVFEQLCTIVEETIKLHHQDNKPLPPPTAGHDFANHMQNVA
jgi:predicted RNase H-like HicB family nuclease